MRLGVEAALVEGRLLPGDLELHGGAVTGVGLLAGGRRERGIAAPGFVDPQVNGFAGVNFMEADPGAYAPADVVVLDDRLEVRRVLVAGAERVAR